MKFKNKNLLVIIVLISLLYFIYNMFNSNRSTAERPFSAFMDKLKSNSISEVYMKENKVHYISSEGLLYSVIPEGYENDLSTVLYQNKVKYRFQKKDEGNIFLIIFSSWLPVLIIIGVMLFFSRQLQNGSKIMGFSKFKLRNVSKDKNTVTFADVAGIDDAKEELKEIVDFLKDPKKFTTIGGRIPTGVLLTGSPGTGKTLLARAVSGEAGVSFVSISGSDFVEMFVGVGASRVRDLFRQARQNAPCIIFIDEIDAVGRQRGLGIGGGNDEREQTLNQLLVEMDGFNKNEGVIILASTNRPDVLDPALLRPGRFDRQVVITPPDTEGREKILKIHSKDVKLDADVDLSKMAKSTVGFTGADLANLINEAALLAGRKKKNTVCKSEFEEARDKILMGTERKTLTMKENEKKSTSYHEAGHALISALSKFLDPIHKVTIIPRGRALGVTMLVPEKDSHSTSRIKLVEMLEMLMGGRAAEELIFNHYTTGASSDLERATGIAQKMVCVWGMNASVGPVYLADGGGKNVFLGKDFQHGRQISNYMNDTVNAEVKKIVNDAYKSAMKKIKTNLKCLHKIAEKLLQEETIEGSEVKEIVSSFAVKMRTVSKKTSDQKHS